MAQSVKYKYNQSEKQYSELVDFSGGMDTIHADSALLDNVARDIVNFDIKAGGRLAKRTGFHAEELLNRLTTATGLTKDVLQSLKTIRSYKFKSDDGTDVVCIFTENGLDKYMINYEFMNKIGSFENHIEVTVKKFTTTAEQTFQVPIINVNGDKAYMMTKVKEVLDPNAVNKVDKVTSALHFWQGHNWSEAATQNYEQKFHIDKFADPLSSVHIFNVNTFYNALRGLTHDVTDVGDIPAFIDNNNDMFGGPGGVNQGINSWGLALNNKLGFESGSMPAPTPGITDIVAPRIGGWEQGNHPRPQNYSMNNYLTALDKAAVTDDYIVTLEHPVPSTFAQFSTPDKVYDFTACHIKFQLAQAIGQHGQTEQQFKGTMGLLGSDSPHDTNKLVFSADLLGTGGHTVSYDDGGSGVSKAKFISDIFMQGKALMYLKFTVGGASSTGDTQPFDLVITEGDSPTGVKPRLSVSFSMKRTSQKVGTTNITTTKAFTLAHDTILIPFNLDIQATAQVRLKGAVAYDEISSPNPRTFGSLSYNFLNVLDVKDLDSIRNTYDKYIKIANTSISTLLTPIITNELVPAVAKPLNVVAPIALAAGDSLADYNIGYRFLPIEQWTSLESNISTNTEYISDVIKTATWLPKGHNIISLLPTTSDNYILEVYATKADPTGALKLEDVQTSRLNINPTDTVLNNYSFDDVRKDFFAASYSLNWKNQWIVYGGSNKFFVSDVNNFGYFPMINALQLPTSEPIVNISSFYNTLVVQTESSQFLLKGSTPADFKITPLNNSIGCIAHNSTQKNVNYLAHLTNDGVYVTKSAYSFEDRLNIEKIDNQLITGVPHKGIAIDPKASAIVHDNRYIIHTPSAKELWIYYNDTKSWVRYASYMFNFEGIHLVNNTPYYVGATGLNIFKQVNPNSYKQFDTEIEDEYLAQEKILETAFVDKDMYDPQASVVVSEYKSKLLTLGLPDHSKKWKAMNVKFEDTIKRNDLFAYAWVDGMLRSTYKSTEKFVEDFQVYTNEVETSQITTIPQARYANADWGDTVENNLSRFDSDNNQLHSIQLGGRGKALDFHLIHKQPDEINISNISIVYKVKKPKATLKRV